MTKQKGQINIIVILFILALGLFFLLQPKLSPAIEEAEKCVNVDLTKKVIYNNSGYYRIKRKAALSTQQFIWHIKEITNTRIDNKTVYRAKTNAEAAQDSGNAKYQADALKDPNQPAGENFRTDLNFKFDDLIFIDVTQEVSNPQSGYVYVDIYVKESKVNQLPTFIQDFCGQNQPVSPKTIFPDKNGNIFPPAAVSKKDISITKQSTISENPYTVFAYERIDSLWGGPIYHTNPEAIIGRYSYKGRTYTVRIVSLAGYLSLVDDNDSTYVYLYSDKIPPPFPTPLPGSQKSIQITTFTPFVLQPWGWWSPECKPAIYLYPQKQTDVHVQVEPKGYLTYTDPLYPSAGWQVTAYPNGNINASGKEYSYLYYESKIRDVEINKPTDGYVIAYDKLADFYSVLLPQLGLSEKEKKDFKTYWEKVLPASPYYFVGIMDTKSIDKIEPLTISPKPTTIIRVRLYFEALDKKIDVRKPAIVTPERNGFSVVEWGGIVKLHPGTEFSCSQ